MAPTLFVLCNGAKTIEDVQHSINSTFGGAHQIIKNVAPLKTDKNDNTYTIVEIYSAGPLSQTRMDRLVQQLHADKKNRGERFYYQVEPKLIEWTIKLHLPKEPPEQKSPDSFTPYFR